MKTKQEVYICIMYNKQTNKLNNKQYIYMR